MNQQLAARLSLLQFLQFFIWGSWFVTAGTYLLETLKFTGTQNGMVYGTTAIAATISPFLLGIIADRFFAVEKLLTILHTVGGILLWIISYVQNFEWFYPLILLYVLCFLPTFSLSNALCFHHVEDTKRDFPRIRVWGTISWILAGVLVGLLGIEDSAIPFRIAATCSFLQAAYCLTLPPTPPQPPANGKWWENFFGEEIRELLRDRGFRAIIICLALSCIPLSYYYSFVNAFLNEIEVTYPAIKMSLGQVTEIILMLALPWFFKIWSLRRLIFWGLFTWGARYAFFLLGLETGQEIWLLICLCLHGVAYIFSMLAAQIYLDTRIPVHLRSTGQGFFSLLTLGIGAFFGSIIAGTTVSFFTLENGLHNWSAIWLLPTVVGVLVGGLFLILYPKTSTNNRQL